MSLETQDECDYILTVKHEAGCPVRDFYYWGILIEDNAWLLGTINVIFGLIVGLYGTRWFQWVAAFTVGFVVLAICGLLAIVFAFTDTTVGLILSIVVAVAGGCAVGALVFFVIWIAIGCLGMASGIIIAILIYTTVFA